VPTDVERFVDNDTDLVLRGQGFELRLAGQCSGGCVIDTSPDGREVLTLEQEGRANVGGEGFLPGALEGIEVGEHTLQVNGTSFDGVPRTANLGVLVNPAPLPAPGWGVLPSTGTDTTALWLVALVMLGLGLVATTRRRLA
jgi:LPXTG-motif cell wall-anchored protein